MATAQANGAQSVWADDLLSRKPYADFLTAYIDQRCVPGAPGMVVAIDAPWGLGKSFFVRRWAASIEGEGRPHVLFDSWENDSAEDPAVSFMSELRSGLAPLYERLLAGGSVERAREKSREMVSNLRKATLPALAVVGKAVLKKLTGVAVDEVLEAASQDEGEDTLAELEEAAPEALEKGLDTFFEQSLKGHTERMRSVRAFRKSLEELLSMLRADGVLHGPLYVFIDELDRCRPDYAIRLLEGIKHLFSVPGVAFVICTNLQQLGKAVGAVYGPAFDGFSYLKRFFDFEYELPEPTRERFLVAHASPNLIAAASISGLDEALADPDKTALRAFALVAEALRLDLRSLQRVLAMLDAASAGAGTGTRRQRLVGLWLFFLAALRHSRPSDFNAVAMKLLTVQAFKNLCQEVIVGRTNVPCRERDQRGPRGRAEVPLIDVLEVLYEATLLTSRELQQLTRNSDEYTTTYPSALRHYIVQYLGTSGEYSSLVDHAELIRTAGHIRV